MNRLCSPQDHTPGQLLGRKSWSSGIFLPVIPALPYRRQRLKYYGVPCADGTGRSEKREMIPYSFTS